MIGRFYYASFSFTLLTRAACLGNLLLLNTYFSITEQTRDATTTETTTKCVPQSTAKCTLLDIQFYVVYFCCGFRKLLHVYYVHYTYVFFTRLCCQWHSKQIYNCLIAKKAKNDRGIFIYSSFF